MEESLRKDTENIRGKISEMAALTEAAVKASVRALTEGNRQLAYSIILRDTYIDELETELDRLCLEFLARHQPVAQDLRRVFSAIQINRELERMGDYAESIARQVLVVSTLEPQPSYEKFVELGDLAVHMLRNAVESFLRHDADLARRTMVVEERANTLRNSINADLNELARNHQLPAAALTPLLTIARRLERVTDQAKNFCEEVLYMCTGEFVKHKSAGFRILFLDLANGALSQMAEAIATATAPRAFVFNSAGITPQPPDPRVIAFMGRKGLDLSRHSSKALEQVPEWECYQVIVCLDPQARDAIPQHPGKTIYFIWPIRNPLVVTGGPEAFDAALEESFQALSSQITDLVAAISHDPKSEKQV